MKIKLKIIFFKKLVHKHIGSTKKKRNLIYIFIWSGIITIIEIQLTLSQFVIKYNEQNENENISFYNNKIKTIFVN